MLDVEPTDQLPEVTETDRAYRFAANGAILFVFRFFSS